MKKIIVTLLAFCLFLAASAQNFSASNSLTNRSGSTDSLRQTHSVGINLGWTDGVSLKFHIKGNVYLQSDIGILPDRIGFPNDNPYHFFDYAFVFSLRYHFGKKN